MPVGHAWYINYPHSTPYVHYELSLKAERINNVPRPSYGWAVLSVRTALRAVLIWDGMYDVRTPILMVVLRTVRSMCVYVRRYGM